MQSNAQKTNSSQSGRQSETQTLKRIHGRLATHHDRQVQRAAGELKRLIAQREKQ